MFIDDKSRYVLVAKFIERDDIINHIEVIKEYGLPLTIYYDNDPKYTKLNEKATIKKGLEELGINVINTTPYQPQGKGKIERKFKTFQDQLVIFMKEKKVKTIEEANKVLEWYVEYHNNQPSRTLDNKNEISLHGQYYLVPKTKDNIILAGHNVEVREKPNKWIKIFYKDEFLVKYNLLGEIFSNLFDK